MLKLLRLFVLILLAPLAFALVYQAYQFLRSDISLQEVQWFLYGLGLYFLLYVTPLRERITFLEILDHELTHTAASLAFLKVPTKLEVDYAKGGKVESARGDFLTALAPYYLPLATLPLLLIKPLISDTFNNALNFAIGLALAFHYGGLVQDFHFKQTDLKDKGIVFSIIVIFVFNVVWLVIILSVVTGSYSSILVYFENVFARTQALYALILEGLRTGEFPTLKDLIEQSAPAVEGEG
jgi:hypothetical protein